MCCGPTQWPWFGTFWWEVEWEDTRAPPTHWYLTSALISGAFLLAALQAWVSCIYYGRSQMWWRMASLGQLPVLRNWSSLLLLITPFTCCTTRRINYVYGSLVNINFFFCSLLPPTHLLAVHKISLPSHLFLCSLFLLHLLSPSPPFLLRFSSPPPPLSLKVFAQSGSAQRGSTFCSYSPGGRLPPCRAPLAWCRLWSSAIIERRSYVPPTILVPSMLMDAVDHLLHVCLLALSWPLQVALLPSPHPSWSSLFLSFVLVCVPFSSISQKRWAKWDQPVAYCPAHPPKLVNSHHSFTQHTSATTFVFHLLPNFTSW